MNQFIRKIAGIAAAAVLLAGCGSAAEVSGPSAYVSQAAVREILRNYRQDTSEMTIDSHAWLYDEDAGLYYQLKVSYCANPYSPTERLSIYVPEDYMNAEDNGDGTFTCARNESGSTEHFTALTAPFVFPVLCSEYERQEAQTSFGIDAFSEFTDAGMICIFAGLRGRGNDFNVMTGNTVCGGAPWGVADLKAAIRFCRLNADVLPGSPDAAFIYGTGSGGAMSEITGTSGDSRLYYSYLLTIGAAMYDKNEQYISDSVLGSVSLDALSVSEMSDAAYEWLYGAGGNGASRAEGTWTGALSDDLSARYAEYINNLNLTDEHGTALTLDTDGADVTSGSYTEYIRSLLEDNASGANTRGCPAFDFTDNSGIMNQLFGTSKSNYRHFDSTLYSLLTEHAADYAKLSGWDRSLVDSFAEDLAAGDDIGSDTRTRVSMYNPLYFVNEYYDGAGTSKVAPHFLIAHSASGQNGAFTADVNLALTLRSAGSDPDFYVSAEAPGFSGDITSWIETVMDA